MIEYDKFWFGVFEILIFLKVEYFFFQVIGHPEGGKHISLLDSEASVVFDNECVVNFRQLIGELSLTVRRL